MDFEALRAEWQKDPEYLRACEELAPELDLDEAVFHWLVDHERKVRWLWAYRLGQWLILRGTG